VIDASLATLTPEVVGGGIPTLAELQVRYVSLICRYVRPRDDFRGL